jgi:hypothetical protein
MRAPNNAAALALAIALLAGSGAGAGAATPGLTVKGDQQAWAEIAAAYTKLFHLKTYRAKFTTGMTGTMEVVNPDRVHTVMDLGTMTMETIQVGKDIRVRQGNGAWQCSEKPTPVPNSDVSSMHGEVSASRGPVVVVDGVQTQSYTYTYTPSAESTGGANVVVRQRLFVANATGLPKRAQTLGDNDKVETQIDYLDFDAPITVSLPTCT